jgi:hypothetical protein
MRGEKSMRKEREKREEEKRGEREGKEEKIPDIANSVTNKSIGRLFTSGGTSMQYHPRKSKPTN